MRVRNELKLGLMAFAAVCFSGCQDRQAASEKENRSTSVENDAEVQTGSTVMRSGQLAPTIDGFKEVKFGMPMRDVAALGYYCFNDKLEGYDGDLYACSKSSTLFGLPANVKAEIADGLVNAIAVSVKDSKPVDLAGLFSDKFGPPQNFRVRNSNDLSNEDTSYWLSPSGSSVLLIRWSNISNNSGPVAPQLLNDGGAPVTLMGQTFYEQRVIYYGTDATKDLLKRAAAANVPLDQDF